MKTLHLLRDLGIYKANLKRKFYRDFGDRCKDRDEHALMARDLLEREGNMYTLDECRILAAYLESSHDGCVQDNPDDYSRVEVWQAEQNRLKMEAVDRIIGRFASQEVANA